MGKEQPELAPQKKYAHPDMLAELRSLETVKQKIDLRVLNAFPLLAQLLEPPEEFTATFNVETRIVQGYRR